MNDADKISSLISALRSIATLPEPGEGGATAEGQLRRARVLAKIALRNCGVPADHSGFHMAGQPLHYKDLPDGN